jgi:Fic family protein
MATRYIAKKSGDESFRAFVPPPLPPKPAVKLEPLQRLLEEANQALGRLDGLASILPDPSLFIYLYVRKEAVLSSQIEGTQSSLSDLLLFESEEAPGVPWEDVQEVSNYVAAMNHGLRWLQEDSHSRCVSFARFTEFCSRTAAGVTSFRANSVPLRTGSAARVPATPLSFQHRRKT